MSPTEKIAAIRAYCPELRRRPTMHTEELVEIVVQRTSLSEGDLHFYAEGTPALADLGEVDEARPLGVEQSNVSLAFGDKGLLKIYRRLHVGVAPELARGAVRISIGPTTTESDLESFQNAWNRALTSLLKGSRTIAA